MHKSNVHPIEFGSPLRCPHTGSSHRQTLNRCPVGLNFSLSLPLISDVPCIALIMYLASAQPSVLSNTFKCLKRQTHHSGAWRLVPGAISILYVSPICATYGLLRGGGGKLWYIPSAFEQKKGHFSLSWNVLVLCEGRIVLKGRRCGQDRCILN